MRLIKKDLKQRKKSPSIPTNSTQPNTVQYKLGKKITFACDAYLLERAKNALVSQQMTGNYQQASLSELIRLSLQAYQQGMPLTVPRQLTNPKKEISLRLTGELADFYRTLPAQSKTSILERALATYLAQKL